MDFTGYIVLGVILFLIVVLYVELIRPTVAFVIGILVLTVAQVISPAEALGGFANEQLAIIVLLLILSNTLGRTRLIDDLFGVFFKKSDGPRLFMFKMLSGVGLSSAFLNNTPLVAMMMPYVNRWSKDKGQSPSRYLIPLSYASILGGCVTLIGTSTNLIANGLAIDYGVESLDIFDFAYVGLPMLLIGLIYLMLFSGPLLPSTTHLVEEQNSEREYLVETIVKKDSGLIGKTVEEAGLRNLEGLFLAEIIKQQRRVRPATPHTRLRAGDKLIFVGDTEHIAELSRPRMGLALPEASTLPIKDMDSIVELVVSHNSTLIGRSVKDSNFRGVFNGAIMAIHRHGERLEGKIGDLEIKSGDLLMVLAGKDFRTRIRQVKDFYQVSQVREIGEEKQSSAILLLLGLVISIVLAVCGVVPLFTSLAILVMSSILLGMQRLSELKNRIDFDLIIIIAMGLALGKAMVNSGVAAGLADQLAYLSASGGVVLLLAVLFTITNLLTAFITSKAAVSIILPVALTVGYEMGIAIPAIVLIVAYGGAASFITPIGYQTNLMVYGPGGYVFKDYLRIGLPLTILYGGVAVWILTYIYKL